MSSVEITGYKIIKTLGVGGQATVYLAIQQGFEREVALKVMSPALAADPSFGERFVREAKIVAKLSHARIVTVYDVGESGSFFYLAMEYMSGPDLKSRINKGIKNKEALTIISKVAQALDFAHQKGYIHRDVKSENILFDNEMQPVLTDFGIAKASNSSTQMTQTGKLIGTPEYMSPEQCRGKGLDGRSDLYSLGIILYEMLTRKVPFTGEDSVSVCIKHVTKPVPQLPARLNHLQWVIDGLLAKNPNDRYQTGKELSDAIESYLSTGEPNRKTDSTSKTQISSTSKVIDNNEMYQNESFELSNDYQVPERIQVQPEPRSRVFLISFLLILIIGSVVGYLKKDLWLPKIQQEFDLGWIESSTDVTSEPEEEMVQKSPQIDESKKSNIEPNKSNDKSRLTSDVDRMIQQADTLAQYTPHELSDIRQALDILTTAKSLEPSHPEVNRIRKDIVAIALIEAATTAENQLFENAEQWLELVASTDGSNPELGRVRARVNQLLQEYDRKLSEQENIKEQLDNYILLARAAIENGRLGYPKNENALYFLQQANNLGVSDSRINKQYRLVELAYIKLIEKTIKVNEYSKAKTYLESISKIPSFETDIDSMRTRINNQQLEYDSNQIEIQKKAKAEQKIKLAQQQRQTRLLDPLVQLKLSSNLQAAVELVEQQRLVEPIGNNALEKYKAVLEIDSLNEQAKEGITNIEKTILTNLDVALNNHLLESSKNWLAKLVLFQSNHKKFEEYQIKIVKMEQELEETASDVPDSLDEESTQSAPVEPK